MAPTGTADGVACAVVVRTRVDVDADPCVAGTDSLAGPRLPEHDDSAKHNATLSAVLAAIRVTGRPTTLTLLDHASRRRSGDSLMFGRLGRRVPARQLAYPLNTSLDVAGAPGGIRTPDPQFRRLMLYPLSYRRTRRSHGYPSHLVRVHESADCVSVANDLRFWCRGLDRARLQGKARA